MIGRDAVVEKSNWLLVNPLTGYLRHKSTIYD